MADPVLESPALLYEIFLLLSQRDLLIIQRVCRKWQSLITSSTRLQAALFLHPGFGRNSTDNGRHSPSQTPELNPLLQESFPDFFGSNEHQNSLYADLHNLGPWDSTQWFCGRSHTMAPSFSLKDQQRMAAFTRAEASWRRMIPCRPAPDELQVSLGCKVRKLKQGTLRCLKFTNKDKQKTGQFGERKDNGCAALRLPWLTFGLLYDIVEQEWFHPSRMHIGSVLFDYSFQDPQLPNQRSRMAAQNLKRPLAVSLPGKTIGGDRCVLVHLNTERMCFSGRVRTQQQTRDNNDFRVEGSIVQDLVWDEEIAFQYTNDRSTFV
jgi:hypothetical protein